MLHWVAYYHVIAESCFRLQQTCKIGDIFNLVYNLMERQVVKKSTIYTVNECGNCLKFGNKCFWRVEDSVNNNTPIIIKLKLKHE